ncbi:hypothetical protein F5B18DRAFT_631346 [Nemania serpens]|nr:hypothetical protein F5B18DRAFT_631346 [Nemania serpens]
MGPDSDLNKYPVYTGVWTNWSRSRVLGATLTLNREDADLLIAFTALFIAFVATRVWRITCFIFHRIYSSCEEQKAIYHQQQVILRNAPTPEDSIGVLLKLFWTNRHLDGRLRPLSMSAIAAVYIVTFIVAGGYSSQISTAVGDEVLIKSANCRDLSEFVQGRGVIGNAWYSKQINTAANYAHECYSNDSAGLVDCRRFVTKKINSQEDLHAGCPFKSDLCRSSSENIRIDSGYLDSHHHFGLNSPADQRIVLRNVFHCAPLNTANFTTQKNTSLGLLTLYHYGSTAGGLLDYVYAAKSVGSQYSTILSHDTILVYTNFDVQPFTSLVKYGKPLYNHTMFYPSDSVGRQDADISIIFLSGNGVFFSEPRGDAWFRVVEKPSFVPSAGGPLPNLYLPSEPASPLGCAAQYQFCNPSYQGTMACGPLAPTPPSVSLASSLHSSSAPSSLYILTCKSLGQLGFIRREDTSPTITSSGLLMPPCNYIAWHKRRWVGAYGLIVMGFSQLRKTTLC